MCEAHRALYVLKKNFNHIKIFSHLKLCLATVTQNLRLVKSTFICLILDNVLTILMFDHTFRCKVI